MGGVETWFTCTECGEGGLSPDLGGTCANCGDWFCEECLEDHPNGVAYCPECWELFHPLT